jgi:Raf kinase inhibitor-like YbhB/YbcL family protein
VADPEFELTSTAFAEGGQIPSQFTCDGADVSPELSWSGAPAETLAMALIVDDLDADEFVHWLVYNMTGSRSGGLAEGASASVDAPPQGTNDFRRVGWGGPCPPSGQHRYRFRLLALDDWLDATGAPSVGEVIEAAQGHVIGSATLNATYQRRRTGPGR